MNDQRVFRLGVMYIMGYVSETSAILETGLVAFFQMNKKSFSPVVKNEKMHEYTITKSFFQCSKREMSISIETTINIWDLNLHWQQDTLDAIVFFVPIELHSYDGFVERFFDGECDYTSFLSQIKQIRPLDEMLIIFQPIWYEEILEVRATVTPAVWWEDKIERETGMRPQVEILPYVDLGFSPMDKQQCLYNINRVSRLMYRRWKQYK